MKSGSWLDDFFEEKRGWHCVLIEGVLDLRGSWREAEEREERGGKVTRGERGREELRGGGEQVG